VKKRKITIKAIIYDNSQYLSRINSASSVISTTVLNKEEQHTAIILPCLLTESPEFLNPAATAALC